MAESQHSRWITFSGLGLIVVLGTCLRLFDLSERSVTHVEMYVPRIRMPQGISVPGERMTLIKVLTGTFSSDTHPPGYYLLMWGWTKCFGTGIWALRLPSVLFAVASIPLVFWLGALSGQKTAGWIGSVLVAANSHNIFWSQVARMFTLACFLGLLATILLLLIARTDPPSRWLQFVYMGVIFLGIVSHIFFWAILATHILWTFLNAWGQRQVFPGIASVQIFALIVGSPLLAFTAYQSGNELATLSSSLLIYAREFVQFSFLFPLQGFSSGVYLQNLDAPLVDDPHLSFARWLFFLLSLLLFVVGVVSVRGSEEKLSHTGGGSPRAWIAGTGLGTLAIIVFIYMAKTFLKTSPNPTLRTTEFMAALPLVLLGLAFALQKNWKGLGNWLAPVGRSRFFIGGQGLVLSLAILPFLVLALISRFKPIFNARGMLLLGPYLLLVLAWGIVRVSQYRVAVATLAVILVGAHYAGLKNYRHMSAGRTNYKAFATELAPHIDRADLVFLQPSWYATPVFYYLNSGWTRFQGENYQTACREHPGARIWALLFYNEQTPKAMEEALSKYDPVEIIEVPRARAVLYLPRTLPKIEASAHDTEMLTYSESVRRRGAD